MGIFDKAKQFVNEHADQAERLIAENKDKIKDGIEKAGDFVDQKTGGKYADKVDQAQNAAGDFVDKADAQEPTAPQATITPPATTPPPAPPA